MSQQHFILHYVDNPVRSAEFYADLLARPALEASPSFALFALDSGLMLGLWAQSTVMPEISARAGSHELAFAVENNDTVNSMAQDWQARGIRLAQTPCQMDFGYTFVALDPDGHRLRVFAANTN